MRGDFILGGGEGEQLALKGSQLENCVFGEGRSSVLKYDLECRIGQFDEGYNMPGFSLVIVNCRLLGGMGDRGKRKASWSRCVRVRACTLRGS